MAVPTTWAARLPPVAWAALMMIAVHLVIRGVLAWGGYFYWDDLIVVGRAGTRGLFTTEYLFDDHDGHVMPGAFLVAGIITRLAPLVWIGPALSLMVLSLLTALSLLRTLHVILGWRPVLLIPLCGALFTPLALPGFAWWAAALNSLPMLIALTWVCADAILLIRTGRQRYAITATLAYLGGLFFFEKAAIIPVTVFIITALIYHVAGDTRAFHTVWHKGIRLWIPTAVLTFLWVLVYLVVVDQNRWSQNLVMTWDLLQRSVTHAIVPGLVGGPWQWHRWAPASPWAVPPVSVMILGWLALTATVVLSMLYKQRIGAVWLVAVGYAVTCQIPIYLMRSSQFTALELAQTLRYLPDLVIVLALLAAVGFNAPHRAFPQWLNTSQWFSISRTRGARTALIVCIAVAWITSSMVSTATFFTSWRDNPTRSYVQNALRDLRTAHETSAAALLDQEVDPLILQRVVGPENLASHMFALLDERPQFAQYTDAVRMLNNHGHLMDATITWIRTIVPGPVPQCGYFIQPDQPARMPLDGPLLPAEWTTEINYLANTEGTMELSLSEGPHTTVPVHPGLNRVYVRLSGAGDVVNARATTAALSLCIASGPVGHLVPAEQTP